jgi:hypothetical protein
MNEAAAKAMELAKNKAELCNGTSRSDSNVTINKQLKGTDSPSSSSSNTDASTTNTDDNDDIIYTIRNIRSAASTSKNTATSDLKSLDDALKDAVKYVKKINENSKSSSGEDAAAFAKSDIYLSEHRLLTLIKKCKNASVDSMDVDNANSGKFFKQ